MKTLAQLIAELQTIPNPEKVGVAIYTESGDYTAMSEDFLVTSLKDIDVLSLYGREKAEKAGLSNFVTI